MARPTYPLPNREHAAMASTILARHAMTVGKPADLPVPIEMIIEQTYELEILWEAIREPPGTTILGALSPRDRRILLNTLHEDMFTRWMGPERFTLAHELGHWVYDADNPDQLNLALDMQPPAELYCYHRDSPGLSEDIRIREMNANKLAAHLLLPEDLVRRERREVLRDLAGTAMKWKVSRTMLEIRLQELRLIGQ